MFEMTPGDQKALQWIGFGAAFLFVLVSSWYWLTWAGLSPMSDLWSVVADHGYFPPSGPKSRVQYWGDITYSSGTELGGGGQGTRAIGGHITLPAGVHVWNGAVVRANGGDVIADPSLHLNPYWVRSSPEFFYPGQRYCPGQGVLRFVLLLWIAGVLGGWLVWGRLRARTEEAVRRPVRYAILGALLFAPSVIYLGLATLLLYIFPPLSLLFLFLVPVAYCFAIVIGFALIAERIGSLAGIRHRFVARASVVALLIALMLIPIAGLFVMTALALVGLGAGSGIRLWRRTEAGLRSAH